MTNWKIIKLRVDPETHEKLAMTAKTKGLELAPMIREAAIEKFISATDETASLRRDIDQLLARLDHLQKQVDAHSGALDYHAQSIFHCIQSIAIKKITEID